MFSTRRTVCQNWKVTNLLQNFSQKFCEAIFTVSVCVFCISIYWIFILRYASLFRMFFILWHMQLMGFVFRNFPDYSNYFALNNSIGVNRQCSSLNFTLALPLSLQSHFYSNSRTHTSRWTFIAHINTQQVCWICLASEFHSLHMLHGVWAVK